MERLIQWLSELIQAMEASGLADEPAADR